MKATMSLRSCVIWFPFVAMIVCLQSCLIAVAQEKPAANKDASASKPSAEQSKSKKPAPAPFDEDDDDLHITNLGYVKHLHEVTVSGQITNEEGKPVAGAQVSVVPVYQNGVLQDKEKLLAETVTDAEGRYRFNALKLGVLEFDQKAVPRPTQALFQVFAIAERYGFAWRHTRAYRPENRPDNITVDNVIQAEHVFFANEPIVLDLTMSPEVRLHGTIQDDLGNPLKNAIIQIGLTNSSRDLPGSPPRGHMLQYIPQSARGSDGYFQGHFVLPQEFRQARTDAEGKYEIRGVPRDCEMIAFVDYLPEYNPWSGHIQTSNGAGKRAFVGYDGEFNRDLESPVTIQVAVTGPGQKPLADVVVRQDSGQNIRRAGTLSRTNADGIATLKLHPGKSTIVAEPTIGQAFLPKSQVFTFEADAGEATIALQLDPAAEVIIEAVEKETGNPISGVAFLSETADGKIRQAVQSNESFVDHPRTDDTGHLKAYFAAGERRFLFNQVRSPGNLKPISLATDVVNLPTDKPTHIRFEFLRQQNSEPQQTNDETIPDELKPLAEILQKQAVQFERSQRARYRLAHSNFIQTKMSREQLTEFLDSFSSKSVDECVEDLRKAFRRFNRVGATEIITDGHRRRVESHVFGQPDPHVNIFNGEEIIIPMGNSQVDIYDEKGSSIHFLTTRDFWQLPFVRSLANRKPPEGEDEPEKVIRHANGVWDMKIISSKNDVHLVVDDSTGFQHKSIWSYGPGKKSGHEIWQFFPIMLPTGIAVPKLSIHIDYNNGKATIRECTLIESVELLDKVPSDAFIYAAPAGTNILDYRGFTRDAQMQRRPPMGVVSTEIPDIVAYRNRCTPAVTRDPVLKIGDKCPKLNVQGWLNADGMIEQPALSGRILVIDFWGIGCGFCVVQLPDVNNAAKHFSDSKIVILGLHDSSGTIPTVAAFAKKKGLIFPTAIDKPDPKRDCFGATFSAFGADGIPFSAVIDTTGRVAFLGQFEQAIEHANRLAKEN